MLFFLRFSALLFVVCNRMFIKLNGQKADYAFVAFECQFKVADDITFGFELDEVVKPCGFFLDRICQLFQSPVVFQDDFGSFVMSVISDT